MILNIDDTGDEIISHRSNRKPTFLFLLFFSAIMFLLVSKAHANDLKDYREHNRQLAIMAKTIETVDNNIHKYLKALHSMKGVEGLVFIYDCDKDIATFSTWVEKLSNEEYKKFCSHTDAVEKFRKLKKKSTFNKAEIKDQYQSLLTQLKKYISWFENPDTEKKLKSTQDMARKILGPPDKENIVFLYKSTSYIFNRLAAYSRPANIPEMWDVAKIIGVKQFSTKTGIDIFKNSPERQKKREQKRYQELGITIEDSIIFGAPPEGVEYPHNFQYFKSEISTSYKKVNLSLLALKTIHSTKIHDDIELMINTYEENMKKFKNLTEKRFGIKDWKKLPTPEEKWLTLAQHWSIKQYQLGQLRLDAIRKMADPKADEDWVARYANLDFKGKTVSDIYQTIKNLPQFQ